MTVSLWVATDHGLVPSDEAAAAICAKLKPRQIVRAEIVRLRSPEQHRLFFALMNVAFEQQSYYATLEDFVGAVKCALGHCHVTVLPDGNVMQQPKSIAFGNMKQDDFQQFFNAAEKFLAEKMGVTVESLRAQTDLPEYLRVARIAS